MFFRSSLHPCSGGWSWTSLQSAMKCPVVSFDSPSAGDLRELPRVPLRGEGSCGGVKTPPCLQALTPSTAQGTYSRPTKTSPCHLGLLGKQVGRDRGAMGRSCVLNVVEWLNGDSVCPGPARGGGRGHPQAKESENLWCLLPSSFWLKTEASKALEGSGGHHGKESSFHGKMSLPPH